MGIARKSIRLRMRIFSEIEYSRRKCVVERINYAFVCVIGYSRLAGRDIDRDHVRYFSLQIRGHADIPRPLHR